jgi:hypothetical protein
MKTIKLYAPGGTGTRIVGTMFQDLDFKSLPVKLSAAVMDTSLSNVRKFPELEECTFLVKSDDNTDGGGKIRSTNGEAIIRSIKPFLLEHEPADYNIVIYNSSGGTGSVAGTEIISEIKSMGGIVIGIVIEDTSDFTAIENCVKTLTSLMNVVEDLDEDIIISYHKNNGSFSKVNEAVITTIHALIRLFSGENDGLDNSDLKHWLQPMRVSGYDASLYSLLIALGSKDFENKINEPVSVASLYQDIEVERLDVFLEYSTFGYSDLTDIPSSDKDRTIDQMHFAISSVAMDDHIKSLSDLTKESSKRAQARMSVKGSKNKMEGLVKGERSKSATVF